MHGGPGGTGRQNLRAMDADASSSPRSPTWPRPAPSGSSTCRGPGRPLVWLPDRTAVPQRTRLDRLAALDALHRDERILRRGLAFLVGTADIDGTRRRIRLPLLAQPVRLERGRGGYRVVPAGDLETRTLADRSSGNSPPGWRPAPGLAGPGWLTAPGTTAWHRRGGRGLRPS